MIIAITKQPIHVRFSGREQNDSRTSISLLMKAGGIRCIADDTILVTPVTWGLMSLWGGWNLSTPRAVNLANSSDVRIRGSAGVDEPWGKKFF